MKKLLDLLRRAVPPRYKLAFYRALASRYVVLAPLAIARAALARRSAERSSRTVVFVCHSIAIRQLKLSAALRAEGWRVILLYQWATPSERPLTEYFDVVHRCVSEWQVLWRATSYRPTAIHVFSTASDTFAETIIRHKPGVVVYDAKDAFERSALTTLGLTRDEVASRSTGQRFCVQHADGLCCRDPQITMLCREEGLSRPPAVFFPEYCWDKTYPPHAYWKPGDEIHVVSAGFPGLEKLGYTHHGYLELSRRLTAQGIHVHMYAWGHLPDGWTFEDAYSDHLKLQEESKYFHLYRTVPFEQLERELPRYHIGLQVWLSVTKGEVPAPHLAAQYRRSESATTYSFVEAGLPCLCNAGGYSHRRLARLGLAIDLTMHVLENAREELEKFLSQDIEARIEKARAYYNVRNHVGRLTAFYNRLEARRRTTLTHARAAGTGGR